jgi:hypothetical protein
MNDYRHEELKEGKERALKIGDKVRTSDGLEGVVVERSAMTPWQWWVLIGHCTARYNADTLIPVEPERVVEVHPAGSRCANVLCDYYLQGTCSLVWSNGDCNRRVGGASPGLLQRMGMATWEEEDDWFVVRYEPDNGHRMGVVTDLGPRSKDDAASWLLNLPTRRLFRWSDGVQG